MIQNPTEIRLRGHHLLCLIGFQGHGYDSAFVQNMSAVHKIYPKQLAATVIPTLITDDICTACAHKNEEACVKDATANTRMQARDQAALNRLGLVAEKKYSTEHILKLVLQNFKTRQDAESVCKDCQWQEKCLWYKNLQT